MAIDKRVGNKQPSFTDKSRAPGQRFDPGPYIGVVKRTVDATRTGRIQVYIPELGHNNPEYEAGWFTVAYASPFGGATRNPAINTSNAFGQTPNSYGFWMIPPDIGNEVLVTFVSGDPGRGFWFACVNSDLSQHMVPGIGASDKVDIQTTPPAIADIMLDYQVNSPSAPKYNPRPRWPVAEFNQHNEAQFNENFFANPKPLHLPQFLVLVGQGLHNDPVRGAIGSSAQRETPSAVFGISTPGRAYGLDPSDDPSLIEKIKTAKVDIGDLRASVRKGGHSIIMDDGDINGEDRLVRFRTAAGHQILMHDSERIIYIGHSTGNAWIEMRDNGQILMYSMAGMAVRSMGPMDFHSDSVINFNAGSAIKMYAGKGIVAETPGSISLTGKMAVSATGMNISCKADVGFSASGAIASVTGLGMATFKSSGKTVLSGAVTSVSGGVVNILGGVGGGAGSVGVGVASYGASRLFGGGGMSQNSHGDAIRGSKGAWEWRPDAFKSIVTVAPTHEPYTPAKGRGTAANIAAVDTDASGNPVYATSAGEAIGPSTATGTGAGSDRQAPTSSYLNQPDPPGGIGNLDQTGVKAYLAQIGYSESSGSYTAVNSLGYLGKYQMGAAALIDAGYVKPGTTNSGLSNEANWTGKDGITSSQSFLENPQIQEVNAYNYTVRNYNALVSQGVIASTTSSDEIAGLLGVSHLLGAGGAKNWYNGQGGSDAYGTTGNQYYNLGRYSQQVLLANATGNKTTTG